MVTEPTNHTHRFGLTDPPHAGSLAPRGIVPVLFRPAVDDQNLKVPSIGLLSHRGEAPCRRQSGAIRLQHVTPPTEIYNHGEPITDL